MTELLHITERPLWEAAREAGVYEMSTRGRTLREVGFIHLSLRHQLPQVAALLYGAEDRPGDLVVLVVDSERLTSPLRYESPAPGAEEYPHLYGPLPVGAVVREEAWNGDPSESSA